MKDRGVRHIVGRHDLSYEPREKYGQKHGAHGHREEVPRVGERELRIRDRRKEKRRKENVEDDVFRALPEAFVEVLAEFALLEEIAEQDDEEVGKNQKDAVRKVRAVLARSTSQTSPFSPYYEKKTLLPIPKTTHPE